MKVRVIKTAWYKKARVHEGQILNYKGNKLPSWATLADGESVKENTKQVQQNQQTQVDTVVQDEQKKENNEQKDDVAKEVDTKKDEQENILDDNSNELSDEEKSALTVELERYRDIAADNDVWIAIAVNTSIKEEIEMLKKALKEKNIEIH